MKAFGNSCKRIREGEGGRERVKQLDRPTNHTLAYLNENYFLQSTLPCPAHLQSRITVGPRDKVFKLLCLRLGVQHKVPWVH